MKTILLSLVLVFSLEGLASSAPIISMEKFLGVVCQIVENDPVQERSRIPECREKFKESYRNDVRIKNSNYSVLVILANVCGWAHLYTHNEYACYIRAIESSKLFDPTQRKILAAFFRIEPKEGSAQYPRISKTCNLRTDGDRGECFSKHFNGLNNMDQKGYFKTKFPVVR